jgi:heme exporter protein A
MFQMPQREQAVDAALEAVGLAERHDQRAGSLSRGLLQRLSLARATIHAPLVLILDEPETGLDAPGRALIERTIAQQRERGGAVVLTSHAVEWALAQASRCLVIERGVIALDAAEASGLEREVGAMLAAPSLAGNR